MLKNIIACFFFENFSQWKKVLKSNFIIQILEFDSANQKKMTLHTQRKNNASFQDIDPSKKKKKLSVY